MWKYLFCLAFLLPGLSTANATIYEYQLLNTTSGPWGAGLAIGDADLVFNFEYGTSNMKLVYNDSNNSIRIFGQTYGTLIGDVTPGEVASASGYYSFDLTYRIGVHNAGDNLVVEYENPLNNGLIQKVSGLLNGYSFVITSKAGEDYAFAFLDIPGNPLLNAGAGWFMYSSLGLSGSGDLNFRGYLITGGGNPPPEVPEPATALLLLTGVMGAGMRKKRSAR